MWDLSSYVQWWEEWQLRILVLGSLSLQLALFVGSMARQVRALKSCMWLAYNGADAVAIFALATLFNRPKLPSAAGHDLEVLWAPVLLLHLGGQHTFTAYSMEDNELWGRHLVTLVSQAMVALYVFCSRWWPAAGPGSDDRLRQAAILLFVVGFLKFIQKAWALKAASFNSLMTSSAVYPRRRDPRSLLMLCFSFVTSDTTGEAVKLRDEEDHDLSLDEYAHKARHLALVTEVDPKYRVDKEEEDRHLSAPSVKEFVDLSDPYSRRLRHLSSYLKLGLKGVVPELRKKLDFSFLMIYTDFTVVSSAPGFLLKLLVPFISLASAVLFAHSHKNGYDDKDVRVTYILLWSTTLLGFLPFVTCPCIFGVHIWTIMAAQQNLIAFSARRRKPTMLMKLSAIMGFKGYINKHWYIAHEPTRECYGVIGLVFNHVKDGWKQCIHDGASYRRFNNLRGQWAMSRHKVGDDPRLLWTLQLPFDYSVLVWHVATELCLHHPKMSSSPESAACRRSRVMSNYMIYLLLIRPEMLIPGTRQALFTNTSDDIEFMLKHVARPPSLDRTSAARRVLRAAQSRSLDASRIGPWILKACKLAEDLMELLLDDDERWLLIQGVWVEMLCYSAGRCKGYLHAKTMGESIEFLTYIWLLLSRLGMETFADKFRGPELAQGNETEIDIDADAGDSASEPQKRSDEEEIGIAIE